MSVSEPIQSDTVSLLRYRGDELSLRAAILIETLQNTLGKHHERIVELERMTECVCDDS